MTLTPDSSDKELAHLVLNRTATGSSTRFAAAALGCYLLQRSPEQALHPRPASAGLSPTSFGHHRRTLSDLGEYRGIMALCRLLPMGYEIKQVRSEKGEWGLGGTYVYYKS